MSRITQLIVIAVGLELASPHLTFAEVPDLPRSSKEQAFKHCTEDLPQHVRLRLGTIRFRQQHFVSCIAFSPDSATFATGDRASTGVKDDFAVKIWDSTGGNVLCELTPSPGRISALAYSANGKLLAACHYEEKGCHGTVLLWDMRTKKMVARFALTGEVSGVAILAGGKKLVASIDDATTRAWDLRTSRELFSIPKSGERLCRAPDDRHFVTSGGADGALFCDIETGAVLRTFRAPEQRRECVALAFSADGKRLAGIGRGKRDQVHIWNIETGEILHSLSVGEEAVALVFRADFSALILGYESGMIRCYDMKTAKCLWENDDQNPIMTLALSAQQNTLLSGDYYATIGIWNPTTGKSKTTYFGHRGRVNCLTYSRDGRWLASLAEDRSILVWNVTTGECLRRWKIRGREGHLAFSPDGVCLAAGEDLTGPQQAYVYIWNVPNDKLLQKFPTHFGQITSIDYSPDGKTMATTGTDGDICLWSTADGKPLLAIHEQKELKSIDSVQFSSDASLVFVRSIDGVIQGYLAATGKRVFEMTSSRRTLALYNVLMEPH